MMKKRVCVFLTVLIMLCCANQARAFPVKKHDDYLELVLFGKDGYVSSDPKTIDTLAALKAACYLSIDQFSGKGDSQLNELFDFHDASYGNEQLAKVKRVIPFYKERHLPSDISEIDFSGNAYHRASTHLGWDHEYAEDIANWEKRKTILLLTVNEAFDFGLFSGLFGIYDTRCNSFCALLYYVHVLGDTIEAGEKIYTEGKAGAYYTKNQQDKLVMPLAVASPGEKNPDIIYEIQKHTEILFAGQRWTGKMTHLKAHLSSLRYNVRKDVSQSDQHYSKHYYSLANELMDLLSEAIPDLLQNESFFSKVFPAN